MPSLKLCLSAVLLSGLPFIVSAQPLRNPAQGAELAYCEQLFALHERYLSHLARRGSQMRDGRADLAIDLCRRQRTAEGIPILEGKLTRARFELPSRS